VRLIGEPARGGDDRWCLPGGKQPAGVVDAKVGLERVRRYAVLLAETAQQLEPAETGGGGQVGKRDPLIPALVQMAPSPADRRMLGPLTPVRGLPRPQMRTERGDRAENRLLDRQSASWLGRERRVGAFEGAAQRSVAEHHPARGAGRGAVALGPVVHQSRLDVEHLVRPPLRDRRHPGVDGLGLEHEQLALAGTLLGGVEVEPSRPALDHRHGPSRVRMGAVGVPDEPGVQRLDAIEPLRVEIGGVLRRRDAKVRMRAHTRAERPRAHAPEGSTRPHLRRESRIRNRGLFRGRDTPIYVQGEELKRAFYAVATGEDFGAYLPHNLDFSFNWQAVDGDQIELFKGFNLHRLPGHTPALMGLQLDLSNAGTFFLTSDQFHLSDNYAGPTPLGWLLRDHAAWFRSSRYVRTIADRTDARLVFGHDADVLESLKREPFYA
jgi:hypothetical protein